MPKMRTAEPAHESRVKPIRGAVVVRIKTEPLTSITPLIVIVCCFIIFTNLPSSRSFTSPPTVLRSMASIEQFSVLSNSSLKFRLISRHAHDSNDIPGYKSMTATETEKSKECTNRDTRSYSMSRRDALFLTGAATVTALGVLPKIASASNNNNNNDGTKTLADLDLGEGRWTKATTFDSSTVDMDRISSLSHHPLLRMHHAF